MDTEIILENKQFLNCLNSCYNILKYGKNNDLTFMGKGKSIMFSFILKLLSVNSAIMICPVPLIAQWELYKEKYNLPLIEIISYESLRGSKNLTHNYLIRDDEGEYHVTNYFKELVENGLIICCDEFVRIKNLSKTQKAVKALCSYIHLRRKMKPYPPKYVGYHFMSTTPYEKVEQIINYAYSSGIITRDELMIKDSGKMTGLQELYNYCLELDHEKTETIMGTVSIRYKNAEAIAYQLCVDVLMPTLNTFYGKHHDVEKIKEYVSEYCEFNLNDIIVDPDQDDNDNSKQTIYNVSTKIDNIAKTIINYGKFVISPSYSPNVKLTEEMIEYYHNITNGFGTLEDKKGVTQGQIIINNVELVCKQIPIAKHALEEIPNLKIVIFVDFKETFKIAVKELENYSTVSITADCSKEEREIRKNKFQEPNLDIRVLITMNKLSAVGVEYDDKYGNFPRIGFGLRGYNIGFCVQGPGRISRFNTKSKSLFIYPKEEDYVDSIDRNISEKSSIYREVLKNNGAIPPDSFVDLYYTPEISFTELLENAGQSTYKIKTKEPIKTKTLVIKRSTLKKDIF